MREKLIELIGATHYGNSLVGENFQEGFIAKIADHLIANDVVQVVRCNECKHCRTASWGEKFCARKQSDGVYAELSNLRDDDFCSYGERKDNG